MKAAREAVAEIPPGLLEEIPDFLDVFVGTPYHVMIRFGLWDEILAEPLPAANRPATTAFLRYARAIALSTLGRTDEAAAEQEAFRAARKSVPATAALGNNSVDACLAVGEEMIAGELAYRRGAHDEAFEHLRKGVQLEDALHYDEPWGWLQPVRHALGALLLEQGRVDEAKTVYEEDLRRHPENGWALHGLAESLRRSGRADEADAVQKRFDVAWEHADFPLHASCFCRTTAGE